MVKSTEDIKVYFVTIPAHKFLHVKNDESDGYWDIWHKQKNIPGQDCDTICGLLDRIKNKLDDTGSSEVNGSSGLIMAYIHDPSGKPSGYGIPYAECFGVRLAPDYTGEVPPQMLMIDVPEAEYIVFEHGTFDYEQENRSIAEKIDRAITNFNFADTEYCFDTSPGRIAYFIHDPKRFGKYIRPVRKSIVIKPLTSELADDYFDFFENRAFTDDSPYRCYCQVFQMTKKQYQEIYDKAKENPGPASREVAERQIADSVLKGYLAYVDGKSIGWCNANDRASYPAEPVYDDTPFHASVENHEKAVICFEIAPECRGKGVATALLNRVLADAKTEGYLAVVSFPFVRSERYEWDCAGPIRLYEKAGFVKVTEADRDERVMMRKELK